MFGVTPPNETTTPKRKRRSIVMGLLNNFITRQILLLSIVFYAFPMFWWTYNDMNDSNIDSDYFLSVKFLMSTGTLLTLMGMAYVALPIDLIPDMIPIFGGMDDNLAKLTAGGGLMMCYMGYSFGSGDTPHEFQIVVTAISTVHATVTPVLTEQVLPLLRPALNAIAIPVKFAMNTIMNVVFDKVKDPSVTETVVNTLIDKKL